MKTQLSNNQTNKFFLLLKLANCESTRTKRIYKNSIKSVHETHCRNKMDVAFVRNLLEKQT